MRSRNVENNSTMVNRGMGLIGWATVIMVAAKAFGFAEYSWFVAFLPAIIGLGLSFFLMLVVAVIALIAFWWVGN